MWASKCGLCSNSEQDPYAGDIRKPAQPQLRDPRLRLLLRVPPALVRGALYRNRPLVAIAALRMRPDRIILGELRGVEALTFLRAVNTGHPGSMTSIHADTPQRAIEQLSL